MTAHITQLARIYNSDIMSDIQGCSWVPEFLNLLKAGLAGCLLLIAFHQSPLHPQEEIWYSYPVEDQAPCFSVYDFSHPPSNNPLQQSCYLHYM